MIWQVGVAAEATLHSGTTTPVTLWLEAYDDDSGVGEMRIANSLDEIDAASWQPYSNTLAWEMENSVVYVQFRDRAGNVSSIYDSNGSEWETVWRVYLPLILHE